MSLYGNIEPYERGMLDVGDENSIYWEVSGNPNGKAALVLHGGPGSGSSPWWRRLFNPTKYKIILFDQRGCGKSTPSSSNPGYDFSKNTTHHLISDIEALRKHLNVNKWLILGGSWGCTLGLAYSKSYPETVTQMIFFGVTTGRHSEFDWTFRGGNRIFFPEQWDHLMKALPSGRPESDILDLLYEVLNKGNPSNIASLARSLCLWESTTADWPPVYTLQKRFEDSSYAITFARLGTHYAKHYGWLKDGELLNEGGYLDNIQGILINGRYDFQAPLENAWILHTKWRGSELIVVDDSGHSPSATIEDEIVKATDKFSTL